MTKTTGALYSQQNKVFHKACQMAGMPYQERKDDWLSLFCDLAGRKGISSFADLSLGERYKVLKHLQRLGVKLFNPRVPQQVSDWQKGDPDRPAGVQRRPMRVSREKYPYVRKIHAILADLKLPWSYADGIAKKRFGVDFVEWCKPGDLYTIVQMLSVYQKRQQKREKGGGAQPGKKRVAGNGSGPSPATR